MLDPGFLADICDGFALVYFYGFVGGFPEIGDIASDSADFVFFAENGVGEDGLDYRATLVARGTEYCDELGHFYHFD
ncbi:hypothetical protein DPV78_011004 [Talaromyces pinophilus]|nr:hypothetical protein DPV78_011004 [Talaromyces pinophilus]